MEIIGVADEVSDGLALRTDLVDSQLEQQIEASDDGSDDSMYAERRTSALEYLSINGGGESQETLESVRVTFEPAPETEDGEFDDVAYANELRRRLIDNQPLEGLALETLADERATSAMQDIITADPGLQDRVTIAEPKIVAGEFDEEIKVDITLSAGAE